MRASRRRLLAIACSLPAAIAVRKFISFVGNYLSSSVAKWLARRIPFLTVPGYSKGAEPLPQGKKRGTVAVVGGGIAGCGADAAPYFRIFNPVSQGEKFDPKGHYVRRFVPELSKLPDRHIHAPWTAPDHLLRRAGVRIGKDYPQPIVDLKTSRQAALAAYDKIKG